MRTRPRIGTGRIRASKCWDNQLLGFDGLDYLWDRCVMRHPAKRIPIKSVRVSLADLRKIYERLLVLVDAEGSKAIAGITRPDNKSEEDFSIEMASLKAKAFRITVTIGGRDGESLFGDDVGVFSSPNIPEHISYIYLTNVVAFRGVANQNPINQFELNLDFSKPPLLDSSNLFPVQLQITAA